MPKPPTYKHIETKRNLPFWAVEYTHGCPFCPYPIEYPQDVATIYDTLTGQRLDAHETCWNEQRQLQGG